MSRACWINRGALQGDGDEWVQAVSLSASLVLLKLPLALPGRRKLFPGDKVRVPPMHVRFDAPPERKETQ